jgi:hypothetical protein
MGNIKLEWIDHFSKLIYLFKYIFKIIQKIFITKFINLNKNKFKYLLRMNIFEMIAHDSTHRH